MTTLNPTRWTRAFTGSGPRTRWVVLALALALGGCSTSDAAQADHDQRAAAEAPEPIPTVPVGTSLTFLVDQTVGTDTHRAGDTFTSTLTGAAMGVEGETVLPAGAAGLWTVVEATKDNGEGEAVLLVRLNEIQVAGERYPIEASLISADLQKEAKDSDAETAAKIGIGAAAGAIAGRILGDDGKDALKGAGVGAAMGTVVALSSRGGSAKLPAGARLVVRVEEPLVLR